jgi:hypothetical protein
MLLVAAKLPLEELSVESLVDVELAVLDSPPPPW